MKLVFSLLLIGISHLSIGQKNLMDEMKDTEEKLLASTKQVNQFFRRFNGEEDTKGNSYKPTDKQYRSESLRKKYLPILFDASSGIDEKTAQQFVMEMVDSKNPKYLDFYKGDWFCEVHTLFSYNGKEVPGILYMRLQSQGLGHAWIIEDVSFDVLKKSLQKDTLDNDTFIHPMSH